MAEKWVNFLRKFDFTAEMSENLNIHNLVLLLVSVGCKYKIIVDYRNSTVNK